jgi:hypothetical protein
VPSPSASSRHARGDEFGIGVHTGGVNVPELDAALLRDRRNLVPRFNRWYRIVPNKINRRLGLAHIHLSHSAIPRRLGTLAHLNVAVILTTAPASPNP